MLKTSPDRRFLRARKFDLPKAILMFTDCEKWRKDFKVDELYQSFEYREKEEVSKIYPQFYHKTDKVSSMRDFRSSLMLWTGLTGRTTAVH